MTGAALLLRITARTQGEGKKGQPQSDLTCCVQSYPSGHPAQVRGIQVLPLPQKQEEVLRTGAWT